MIIAISGKSGCGNSTVSRLVAEELSLKWINYTFRNIAAEKGVTLEQIMEEANKSFDWDIYLDNKQKDFLEEGNCVLGSRLAIWLAPKEALKVYLYASPEVRAQRIRKREGGDFKDVFNRTKQRDISDSKRYKELYGIDIEKYQEVADIIIDTENMTPKMIKDIITQEAKKRWKV
ncbi:(d)CMP kinase [Spirochaetia bacterium 38H-sp]|uniref:Cytidylate kinase n=1 Tax=Rarispira pelagica TaxID=3141764 RepID=A0ABU9UB07_9SPIR